MFDFFKKGKQKVQGFALKKMMESQMKNVPKEQQDMMIKLVEENPDFFEKISKEIKEKMDQGKDQTSATFEVMRNHQGELQKLMSR